MGDGALPEIVVLPASRDGDRFVVVPTAELLKGASGPWTVESTISAMGVVLRSAPAVTELEVRRRLDGLGMSGAAADAQVAKAHRMRQSVEQLTRGDVVFERTTKIGYRNGAGQVVVRKTGAPGTQAPQRVFVLRCGYCNCEYRVNGSDTPTCRCPECQGGTVSLPEPAPGA